LSFAEVIVSKIIS